MKKINIVHIVTFFCFFSISLFAELKVPKLSGRVVDKAGILSSAQKAQVLASIRSLETGTGGQMAILIIPSLKGESLEEFSIKVAETWKIGYTNKDNGAILLISQKDRKIRLEIGDGWEGFVNDAKAGDIIRSMGPYFRNANYDKGIIYAVNSIQKYVTGKAPANALPPPRQPANASKNLIVIIFLFIFAFAIISLFRGVVYGSAYGTTYYGGGHSRGGWSSGGGFGGGGGGGFSGGGGGFSGGGASGGW